MLLPPHITSNSTSATRNPVYALVGNPNCGKSTLFNALTGLKQKVGNYPGVTVEKKIGTAYSQHGTPITVVDLPGSYSLAARSPDEAVTRDVLLGRRADTPQPDRILCVVDATNLERNLYLVHQILDLGRPVILVLNMMDLAAAAGAEIKLDKLEAELGIPVIACEAVNGRGVIDLKLAMSRADLPLSRHAWDVPAAIAPAVAELQASLTANDGKSPLIARAEALLLLTDRDSLRVAGSKPLSARTAETLAIWQRRWEGEGTDWAGILVNSRYEAIGAIAAEVVTAGHTPGPSTSDRIDDIVTHPLWGWLTLGGVMAALFFLFAGSLSGFCNSFNSCRFGRWRFGAGHLFLYAPITPSGTTRLLPLKILYSFRSCSPNIIEDIKVIISPFCRNLGLDILFNRFKKKGAILIGKRNSFSFGAGSGRTSDAMDVILTILRQIVIYNVRDTINMQASRCNVSRNKNRQSTILEIVKYSHPLALLNVS